MKEYYSPIRILMADDHELFRDGFVSMFKRIEEIEVIGDAANGIELMKLIAIDIPDVVILDIKMPVLNGIETTKRIKAEYPQIGVIALSMIDDDTSILDILDAGAKGYLLKDTDKSEIIQAIKKVHKGETYYCRHTRELLSKVKGQLRDLSTLLPSFSKREKEVINSIADGLASKEIANRLGLKPRTVESYRENIMTKMNVNNSAALIIYAIKNEIIKL